jgi:ABC-type transport system substrate-binding protein
LFIAAGLSAQDKGKKPPAEQEESPEPVIRKQVPDDDEGDRSKVPARVGDRTNRGPRPEKTAVRKPADLAAWADRSRNSDLKEFYHSLSVPHDIVTKPGRGISYVTPISQYVGDRPTFEKPIRLRPLNRTTFKPGLEEPWDRRDIESVEHYEEFAIHLVDDLLKKKPVSEAVALEAAERALTAVYNYHESAMESGERDRDDPGWKTVTRHLTKELRKIKIRQFQAMPKRDPEEWEAANDKGEDLRGLYPDDTDVLQAVVAFQVERARKSLDLNDFTAARLSLERLERQAPDSQDVVNLRDRLSSEAQRYLNLARDALKNNDMATAKANLDRAVKIWPQLPGLRDQQLKLENAYPILYVGVRSLPQIQNLWPGAARLDSERQGVELLFESLVRPQFDNELGLTYQPALAQDRPRLIPLGRQFDMVKNAHWSDGKQVTAVDVRRTLDLVKTRDWPGYRPECKDMVDDIRVGSDPYQVNVTLKQGYLDPLALMDFKVLPAGELLQVDAWKLRPPLGSGPFRLKDGQPSRDANNRPVIVFEANSYYRSGQPDVPRIREIHFFQSPNPTSDFTQGRMHLLLDLPTDELKKLKADPAVSNAVTFDTLRNRRIYFLAINHRRPKLHGQEHEDLRRALYHAVDRETILNREFRAGFEHEPRYHRILAGPYPSETWACPPKLKSPFNRDNARRLVEKVESVELSLKYPAGDPNVARACTDIKEQIEGIGTREHKITIKLEPVPVEELFKRVELDNDYDLAYYQWDYPTEDYWLYPLLAAGSDNVRPGGPNFMGWENDGQLMALFARAKAHRQFKEVQKYTHMIHTHLFHDVTGKVPFIPLWQLDTHIAYVNDLKPVGLDALRVFTHVEEWRLERR